MPKHIKPKIPIMRTKYCLIALALLAIFFQSCDFEGIRNEAEELAAPTVPSKEMFAMPMESLEGTESDTTMAQASGVSFKNWAHSGLNILFWNTAVVLHSAIPFTAFGLAVNEKPVYLGNAIWEWSYTYVDKPLTAREVYDVVLTAEYINSNEEVNWVMKVSKRGEFEDFVWYSGVSRTDFSAATFVLNHQPESPEQYLQIEFERNSSNDDVRIRYTNVSSDANQGGYIEYREESNNPYNRSYDVLVGPNDPTNFLEIQWIEPTRVGRVKHPSHFGDQDWHCWDQFQIDIECQ